MNPQGAQNYLRTKVMTATPEQLQLMLYDGALRFGEQARVALEKKNYEESYQAISRVQKIITEFTSTLRHDVYPELTGKLASLYSYAYRKLIEANIDHRLDSLDEALKVLRYQRETWQMLLQQLSQQKAAVAARSLDFPTPSDRMEATISMQG